MECWQAGRWLLASAAITTTVGGYLKAKLARPGVLERYWRAGPALFANYAGRLLAVTALAPGLVRIRLATSGTFAPRRSWAVTRPDEAYSPPRIMIAEAPDRVTVMTDWLRVGVVCEDGRVCIEERQSGRVILDDGQGGMRPSVPSWQKRGRLPWPPR